MSLAAIHITKKELGLTESEYRAILREVAGVDSAKYLDESGDRAVMARLYALRDERRQAAKKRVKTPTERKIWALWLGGDDRPGLRNYLPQPERTASYLLGFVRRASGTAATRTYRRVSVRIRAPRVRQSENTGGSRPLRPDRERGVSNH